MIITISGNAGSGKDTIAELLAKKLRLRLIKATMKTFAKDKGIDILEFERNIDKEDDYWDRKLDEWQKEKVKQVGDCILASMLGAYVLPGADLKVWLGGRDKVRGGRIAKRDKRDKGKKSLDYVRARDKIFRDRIKRVYGIDFWDPKFYDLTIDTSDLTPQEIVEVILKKLKKNA